MQRVDIHLVLVRDLLLEGVKQLYLEDHHCLDREVRKQKMVHQGRDSTRNAHLILLVRYQPCSQSKELVS